MEKKKIIDLIKLEVLGCINEKDSETLRLAKETDLEFPWKDLGDYQNLVALLPSALTLEFPAGEVKDKVAMKLYNIRDEIKAKVDAKKALLQPVLQNEEQTGIEEVQLEEIEVLQNESELSPISVVERTDLKRTVEEIPVKTDQRGRPIGDRELVEKAVREYFKSNLESQLNSIKKKASQNFIIAIAFFVISLILILILFFKG
ncbi:MAG: hypothetical protein ACHQLA_01615 [Ignavibacteriales bacterium]